MFSKSKVDYNPRNCQPLFCSVYELARPLALDQYFEKWNKKITPGIYLGISSIHASTVALLLSLLTGRVSPQLHIAVLTSFTTINGCDGNLVPPS